MQYSGDDLPTLTAVSKNNAISQTENAPISLDGCITKQLLTFVLQTVLYSSLSGIRRGMVLDRNAVSGLIRQQQALRIHLGIC